jgi:hypothetical protein
MILGALLAAGSALLGGAIAVLSQGRPGVLERTRTFAFAAAAGVVAFHLLPEVLPAQGLVALLWMAAGFSLPWALEAGARVFGPRLLRGRGLSGLRVAAEIGFLALVFHSVAEGLALMAALGTPRANLDLEIALVAHHAPLTAAVVLPFLDLRGVRSAASRAIFIGAAGVTGVIVSSAVPGFGDGAFLQDATAATAGALLHVVADEIRAQRFDSRLDRALDLGACGAGLLVAGLGAILHMGDQGAEPVLGFLRALSGIALSSAPALLCGVVAGALLASRTRFFRWDAFLLLLVLAGPAAAAAWAALTVLLALPVVRFHALGASARPVSEWLAAAVRMRAPPLLMLSIAAAGLDVSAGSFPSDPLPALALWLVVALAARLDDAGAALIAAVLVRKGLDPGIAVALLAIGPITRVALVRLLADRGRIRAAAELAIASAAALGAGKLLSALGGLRGAQAAAEAALQRLGEPLPAQVGAAPVAAAAAALLIAAALGTLWSEGVRGWFAPLRHGPRTI